MSEPSIERYHGRTLPNRMATIVAAPRPAFLTASVLPVLAAGALSAQIGQAPIWQPLLMLAAIAIALIHASANVLNDYFDAVSGNDAANTAFVHPFSGGSRFIQNEVLSEREMLGIGIVLMVAGVALGLAIVWLTGPMLLLLGINSVPDIAADRAAGKMTLPARLGATRAALVFPLWFLAGFVILLLSPLPRETWVALLAAVPAVIASRAAIAGQLIPAMPLTIITHAAVSVLLTAGLLAAKWLA